MKSKVRLTGTGAQKPDKTRDPIPKAIKILVWNKYVGEDYGKAKCFCCNVTEIRQMNFHCGHIVSVADGGGTTIDNLRPICQSCNSSMGTTNMIEFMKKHGLSNQQEKTKEINNQSPAQDDRKENTFCEYQKVLKNCGLKTIHESDLLSLVNKALQFERELIDIFIAEEYILNTKAKKYKKVTMDEFRNHYEKFVYNIYGEDMKWKLNEDSLDKILFDNIMIEERGIKINKKGVLKGVKLRN